MSDASEAEATAGSEDKSADDLWADALAEQGQVEPAQSSAVPVADTEGVFRQRPAGFGLPRADKPREVPQLQLYRPVEITQRGRYLERSGPLWFETLAAARRSAEMFADRSMAVYIVIEDVGGNIVDSIDLAPLKERMAACSARLAHKKVA